MCGLIHNNKVPLFPMQVFIYIIRVLRTITWWEKGEMDARVIPVCCGCWYHNNTWGYVLSYICDCIVYTHFRIIFIEEEKRAETGRARRPGVVMVADWQFAPRSKGWWSKQKEFSPFSIMYTFPTNGSEHTDIENNNNNNNKRNMTHALKVIYLGYQYV